MSINWDRVSNNLICPDCGARGHLSVETDGMQAEHTHFWAISREEAQRISDETRTAPEELKELVDSYSNEQAVTALEKLK